MGSRGRRWRSMVKRAEIAHRLAHPHHARARERHHQDRDRQVIAGLGEEQRCKAPPAPAASAAATSPTRLRRANAATTPISDGADQHVPEPVDHAFDAGAVGREPALSTRLPSGSTLCAIQRPVEQRPFVRQQAIGLRDQQAGGVFRSTASSIPWPARSGAIAVAVRRREQLVAGPLREHAVERSAVDAVRVRVGADQRRVAAVAVGERRTRRRRSLLRMPQGNSTRNATRQAAARSA